MAVRFWLDEIQFSDTTKITLETNDIVVFVGSNNAGKSASLKKMLELIKASHYKGKVIKTIDIIRVGNESDLFSLISSKSIIDTSKDQPIYHGFGFGFYQSVVKSLWDNYKKGIEAISPLFCNLLTTRNGLRCGENN